MKFLALGTYVFLDVVPMYIYQLLDENVKRISGRRFPTYLKGMSKWFLDLAHPPPEIATMTHL